MTSARNTSRVAPSSKASFGVDLHLELRGRGLRAGLTDALRDAVRSGRLTQGTLLPSSRSLAADLGIARNTVVKAYSALVAEGWLSTQQGSGTRVAHNAAPRRASGKTVSRPTHNLRSGQPDVSAFPRALWLRAARKAITQAPDEALGYCDPLGRIELRAALAEYLARARGVHATVDRVIVCSGVAHGLMLLAQVLRTRGVGAIAVESYGLHIHRGLLAAAGLHTPALAIDENGARTGELAEMPGVGAVLLTAAHHFPTGVELRADRRAAAVDWARSTGGLIIEDDYDGEFRYDGQSVGALQELAPDQTIYLGTASKSLAPGLRLGWMVVPEALAQDIERAKGEVDWMSSTLEQLILAEFLSSGGYDRHVRTMRLQYRRRRDQLVAALAARAPGIRVTGLAAGLHAVVEVPRGTEESALQAATRFGVTTDGIDLFRHADVPPDRDALIIGYATPSRSAWAGALDALCRALA
ncbi:PLP-dependent aminotransferase family protein [Kribbella antibiotica]|uniref:PLP-dependent aminotransferase family protein n=1 Tax=Kribbella antibiotica TaxID=190195 RepID=A0A4R4Z9D4_9ACTN|nr:PLP-dependent aminotransferase family protein [Kribbella antibiotica]TDD53864.1 PLP-dependent aminotransferase family protein [Kribbella antibiotica]